MRNLETSGMFAQVTEQIEGTSRILMGKKLMTSDDNEEFISMVISFAERKSMTISNIKDAIREVITYLEDNATLNIAPKDWINNETDEINVPAGLNYYASHEELTECMKNAKCTTDPTQNKGDFSIDDYFAKLENENISTKGEEPTPLKQINEQASKCSIDKMAENLSQKIQEIAQE